MGPGLRIRPAAEADLDALEAIESEAFASDRASRRQLLHAVRSETMLCLVAERDGRAAGYATVEFRRGSRVAHLASIAVSPAMAGRGLGRELLTAAEGGARARSCDRLRLEVRADNAAAQHLYDRAGYARIGEEDDYYEDGSGAWRYQKRLV